MKKIGILRQIIFALVVSVIFISGCKMPWDSSDNSTPGETAYSIISMKNNGAVVPNAVVNTTTLKSDLSIVYYKNDAITWSNKINNDEFRNIENICSKNNILSQNNVVLKDGQMPSVGSRGMEFYIKSSTGKENIFTIDGAAMGYIPDNINELMTAIGNLTEKYKK